MSAHPAPDALLREALERIAHWNDKQALYAGDAMSMVLLAKRTLATTPPASAPDALAARAFETCPICQGWTIVKLVADWNDGRVLPVIACGNPWHYVFPATPPASAEQEFSDGPCPECGKAHWHRVDVQPIVPGEHREVYWEQGVLVCTCPPEVP